MFSLFFHKLTSQKTNTFSSVASGLVSSADRMTRAVAPNTTKTMRIVIAVVALLVGVWLSKLVFARLF
jgi:hypothetical protein